MGQVGESLHPDERPDGLDAALMGHRTGQINQSAGLYRCNHCRIIVPLNQKVAFPKCPREHEETTWSRVVSAHGAR